MLPQGRLKKDPAMQNKLFHYEQNGTKWKITSHTLTSDYQLFNNKIICFILIKYKFAQGRSEGEKRRKKALENQKKHQVDFVIVAVFLFCPPVYNMQVHHLSYEQDFSLSFEMTYLFIIPLHLLR